MGQEFERSFNVGLNFGVNYVSKYTAKYYNGNENNVNNIKYVFSNYYWYQQIYQSLNAHDTVFVEDLPSDMAYKLNLSPGLFLQYNITKNLSIQVQFNYLKLKTKDAFLVNVDPKEYLTFPDLRTFLIFGTERRVYADIGLRHNFNSSKDVKYFISAGVNINSTKVIKSAIYIDGVEYTLINRYGNQPYSPVIQDYGQEPYQGGIGFGAYTQFGGSYIFNNLICVEPFFNLHFLNVNLEGYNQMRPGFGAGLRFIY